MTAAKSTHQALLLTGWLSPVTAIFFSLLCWLVFSRLFDTSDPTQLPTITRRFLALQPWWLAAAVVNAIAHAAIDKQSPRRSALQGFDLMLMIASAVGIAWGIIAMYVLILAQIPM
jgi:hypothetical protein